MNFQFRYGPACFVGNPHHWIPAMPVIVEFDKIAVHQMSGGYYVPTVLQQHGNRLQIQFQFMTQSGIQSVKVFSNN